MHNVEWVCKAALWYSINILRAASSVEAAVIMLVLKLHGASFCGVSSANPVEGRAVAGQEQGWGQHRGRSRGTHHATHLQRLS